MINSYFEYWGLDFLPKLFSYKIDTFIFLDKQSEVIYELYLNKEYCKIRWLIRADKTFD
jgi:hypothetical protein